MWSLLKGPDGQWGSRQEGVQKSVANLSCHLIFDSDYGFALHHKIRLENMEKHHMMLKIQIGIKTLSLSWIFDVIPKFAVAQFKVLRLDNAKSKCLHLYKCSLICVLRFTLKLYPWKMHTHTAWICLTFLTIYFQICFHCISAPNHPGKGLDPPKTKQMPIWSWQILL